MSSKLPKLKIKRGAKVKVIAGAERGKEGVVLDVDPRKMKIKVQGVAIKTHFDKKDGIKQLEGYIDYSNVKMTQVAPDKKPTARKKTKSAAAKAKSEATA